MHRTKERAEALEVARRLSPVRKVTPWLTQVCEGCGAHVRFEPMWRVMRRLPPTDPYWKPRHYCFVCCKDEGDVRDAERVVMADYREQRIEANRTDTGG